MHFGLEFWLLSKKSGKIWNIRIPLYWEENYFICKVHIKVPGDPEYPVVKTGQEEKNDEYT